MKALLSSLALTLILSACKNGWTVAERNDFVNSCTQAAAANMGQDKAKAYCSCMQQKLEAKYPSSADAQKAINAPNAMQTPEMTALVQGCLNGGNVNTNNNNNGGGIFGGGLNNKEGNQGGGGTWSAADEQSFLNTCVQNATNAGADKQTSNEHCNCVLQKIEAKYASYEEANKKMTSQEVNAIEQQCIQERGGANNNNNNNNNNNAGMGGAWSNADEQKFMNTCVQNAINTGADRQTSTDHCNCVMKKIEAKYHSWDDANTKMTKQEVSAIEQQCVQERNNGGNDNYN